MFEAQDPIFTAFPSQERAQAVVDRLTKDEASKGCCYTIKVLSDSSIVVEVHDADGMSLGYL